MKRALILGLSFLTLNAMAGDPTWSVSSKALEEICGTNSGYLQLAVITSTARSDQPSVPDQAKITLNQVSGALWDACRAIHLAITQSEREGNRELAASLIKSRDQTQKSFALAQGASIQNLMYGCVAVASERAVEALVASMPDLTSYSDPALSASTQNLGKSMDALMNLYSLKKDGAPRRSGP